MGQTATRAAAAVMSLGSSELVQKKPFQPGKDQPIGGASSIGRWLPGGALVGGALDVAQQRPGMAPLPETTTASPETKTASAETTAVQEIVAEGSRRRKLARGYRSTILSQFMPKGASALQETIGT